MNTRLLRGASAAAILAGLLCLRPPAALAAATITIFNTNAAGVGFNDPTRGDAGRRQHGHDDRRAEADRLSARRRHLGSASGQQRRDPRPGELRPSHVRRELCRARVGRLDPVVSDFPGARVPGTWYVTALANKQAGVDVLPGDPKTNVDDIRASFNSNLALQLPGGDGMVLRVGRQPRQQRGPRHGPVARVRPRPGLPDARDLATGAENLARPDIFERNILDTGTGKFWSAMTDSERAASAVNGRHVVWNGAHVFAAVPHTLSAGTPLLTVNSPGSIAGDLSVGTASFGPQLTAAGLTGQVVAAADPADTLGPSTTDGCSPLSNASAVAGKIALVDRGPTGGNCTFVIKAHNCQNAGAIGMIVADNVLDSPPAGLGGTDNTITIPSVRITMADGATLRSNLSAGVNVTLRVNPAVRAGADSSLRPFLNSTNPVQVGSSISHWDPIAFPICSWSPTSIRT